MISSDYIVTIQHLQIFDDDNHVHEHAEDDCYHSYDDPDTYLIEYRNEVQEFYTIENENMIEKLNLDFLNAIVSYSYFAPFIQIIFDDNNAYENSGFSIETLLTRDDIDTIYINNGTNYSTSSTTKM